MRLPGTSVRRLFAVSTVALAMFGLLGACGNDDTGATPEVTATNSATAEAVGSPVVDTGPGGDGTGVAPDSTSPPDVTVLTIDPVTSDPSPITIEEPATSTTGGVQLTLRANGLGPFDFGAPAETVIAAVTGRLGPPTEDSGWIAQPSPCEDMGELARYMTWGWVNLSFSNGPDQFGPAGTEHFTAYSLYYSGDGAPDPKLLAEDGQPVLGVTVTALAVRYPGTKVQRSEIEGPIFVRPDGLVGGLNGETESDAVGSVRAGNICID